MAIDIEEYTASLYSRIGEVAVLKGATIDGGDWEPQKTCATIM